MHGDISDPEVPVWIHCQSVGHVECTRAPTSLGLTCTGELDDGWDDNGSVGLVTVDVGR